MHQRPNRRPDWQDTHRGPVAPSITTARQAFDIGLQNMPTWVDAAMTARDSVVRRFGLTASGDEALTQMPVLQDTTDVFETGLTDKHLTFSIETILQNGHVAATTRIWFNHWSGRLYLTMVLIPHKIIMRHIVRSLS